MKILKSNWGGSGGGGQVGGGGSGWWGQGGCKRRIEVFWGVGWVGGEGSSWGVRMDVNGELKFLGKFTTKNRRGGGVRWGVGLGGIRVDVKEELKFL